MVDPVVKRDSMQQKRIDRLSWMMDKSLKKYEIKRYFSFRQDYYFELRVQRLHELAARN